MRKTVIIILVLLMALSGAAIRFQADFARVMDTVTYDESRQYGDPSVVNGMNIDLFSIDDKHLTWNSRLSYKDGKASVNTEGRFLQSVELNNEEQTGNSLAVVNRAEFSAVDTLDELFQKYIDGLKINDDYQTVTVRLNDLIDCYPLGIESRFTDPVEIHLNDTNKTPAQYNDEFLTRYFHIPMRGNLTYYIHVKNRHLVGWDAENREDYYPVSQDAADSGRYFWFWIRNTTYEGAPVDVSQIKGGYGIYRIPYGLVDEDNYKGTKHYKGPDVFVDEIEMIHAVDPTDKVLKLEYDERNKAMLLWIVSNGRLTVRSLDSTSGKLLKETVINSSLDAEAATIYSLQDIYAVITSRHVTVVNKNDLSVLIDADHDANSHSYFEYLLQTTDRGNSQVFFWEGRLYVVGMMDLLQALNVVVFDKNGLAYAAEFKKDHLSMKTMKMEVDFQ